MAFSGVQQLSSKSFTCGFCGNRIASSKGWYNGDNGRLIYVCSHCDQPTYFAASGQIPGVAPGEEIQHLPAEIEALYREARNCVAASCYTAAVLLARKLLMHIGVQQGAQPNQSFLSYVDHLATAGYVPPNGRAWVDHIRNKGNEATHKIVLMTQGDAQELLAFAGMLLKFIYEFPNRVPK